VNVRLILFASSSGSAIQQQQCRNAMSSCHAGKCSVNYAEKPQFHSSESGICFPKNQMKVDVHWFVLVRLAKTLPRKLS